MNSLFPLGFSGPTALYITLYVVTLIAHVALMNYVLAGTAFLAGSSVLDRGKPSGPAADALKDWLTVGLSAAITAGVAPLLFIQILYKKPFYTANLLLSHRWMAILPVLILGFYLLYLLKSTFAERASGWVAPIIAMIALACFVFTGVSWSENHLLSLNAEAWPTFYASGHNVYVDGGLVPRILTWTFGAMPTMAAMVAWQVRLRPSDNPDHPQRAQQDGRRLASFALAGLGLTAGSATSFWLSLAPTAQEAILGPMTLPYAIAAALGGASMGVAWIVLWKRPDHTAALWIATIGSLLTITGGTVAREAIRLSTIDITALEQAHHTAANQGGALTFVLFFVINAVLIGWCIRTGYRAQKQHTQDAA